MAWPVILDAWPVSFPTPWDADIPVQAGYDPLLEPSSAVLSTVPYCTSDEVAAELGSANYVIEATDDTSSGNLNTTIFATILSNVTNEINAALAAYPNPLVRTGTVAVIQVTSVDSVGAVTGIQVLQPGFYLSAPASPNIVDYPKLPPWADPNVMAQQCSTWNVPTWMFTQQLGSGLSLTVAFIAVTKNGFTGQVLNGTPTVSAGGTGYQVNDVVLLQGGSSFLPPSVKFFALTLVCERCYKRRLAADEINPIKAQADGVRKTLDGIRNGDVLDPNYRRIFSPGGAWVTPSRLNANSL